MNEGTRGLGWAGIARLGLVQLAIGAVVVVMTSTLNRVMVVELALPAVIPGALVGLHFAVQLLRPRMGFGSDRQGRRIPWILGGMALVSASGIAAALATAWMSTNRTGGLLAAVIAFALLGVGVSASSTPFLAFLAERVDEERMAGAAALAWILMIVGIIATAGIGGALLDPFSMSRMVGVTTGISIAAFLLTCVAVLGRKDDGVVASSGPESGRSDGSSFREAVAEMWGDPESRRFAVFIFVSMLAYSAQDIILEPFAGAVFGMTPGESTRIAGLQHQGVLLGMIAGAGVAGRFGPLTRWAGIGCLASAVALIGLIAAPGTGSVPALKGAVFTLGLANGIYAVAAIGSMMGLTVRGRTGGPGLRMGFWGASQAMAYGLGGVIGGGTSDLARLWLGSPALGFSAVFLMEAVLFAVAALLIFSLRAEQAPARRSLREAGEQFVLQG